MTRSGPAVAARRAVILARLREHGALIPTRGIARITGKSTSTVLRDLAALEAIGAVTRSPRGWRATPGSPL